jgi:hypothetical protein
MFLEALIGFIGEWLVSTLSLAILLFVAGKLAWVSATGRDLFLVAGGVSLVAPIPRVGALLAVLVFFWLVTRYLGVSGMHAAYMLVMAAGVQLVLFALTIT